MFLFAFELLKHHFELCRVDVVPCQPMENYAVVFSIELSVSIPKTCVYMFTYGLFISGIGSGPGCGGCGGSDGDGGTNCWTTVVHVLLKLVNCWQQNTLNCQ